MATQSISLNGFNLTVIFLDALKLDLENPRIGNVKTEEDVISFLFTEEKTINLAQDIAENGFSKCEFFMVLPDGEKYIVLEGNRRLAALKCLNNPNLAPKNFFKKLSIYKENYCKTESVICSVVSSREEARLSIIRKHGGEDDGKGAKKWGAVEKARFNEKNKNNFARLLIEHLSNKGILKDKNPKKYDISVVTRFIKKPIFSEYTGIYYDNADSKVVFLHSYDKNHAIYNFLQQFFQEILNKEINSRTHNKADEIVKYFEKKFNELNLVEVFSIPKIHKSKGKNEKEQTSIKKEDNSQNSNCTTESCAKSDVSKNDNSRKTSAPKPSVYDQEIKDKLDALGYSKYSSIYGSLSKLKNDSDTPLIYVAFNCLLEGFANCLGRKTERVDDILIGCFDERNKSQPDGSQRISDNDGDLRKIIVRIRENANLTKHSTIAACLNYKQACNDMETLKSLLMVVIGAICEKKDAKKLPLLPEFSGQHK
ncbi:hypothetical protein [Bartonella sp. CB60]|uniref:hypothetical protein n=1 Tax=Bartonella sp. CB60 TaxID=3113619 RepID=UPI00300E16A0